jgi:putative ABC transport system permease protein
MESLRTDFRLAGRNLARRPGFSMIVALTLALGIGTNVAMFAVVHSVLIRPLPYPEPDRIVVIHHHAPGLGLPDLDNSPGTIAVYREHAGSFSHVAAVANRPYNLTGGDEPARVRAAIVSFSIFDVLGVEPAFGRRLLAEDATQGAAPVVVLTHAGWTTHFGGAGDVLGRTLELDGVRHEIVGVMPRGFGYPDENSVAMLPMGEEAQPSFGAFGIGGIARLAPGVEMAAADVELDLLQALHVEAYSLPPELFETAGWRASLQTLHEATVRGAATMLWVVLGTAAFLLLVACAGVANLFLIRADGRRRELGVRMALGATRGRVASAMLAESLLLGAAGGIAGVALAWFALSLLVASGPPVIPRLNEVDVGAPVFAFAALLSLGTGVLFGLLPLPQQMRRATAALARGGRTEIGGRDRQRLRRGLIVVQIALALVLLTGSGLMLRSFQQLRALDTGIDPAGVLVVGVSGSERADASRGAARYVEMLEAARGVAGARVVGLTTMLPIAPDAAMATGFAVESRIAPSGGLDPVVWFAGISDDYFAAVGTPVRAGRELTLKEVTDAQPVAIVNEMFVRSHLEGDPLGQRIRFDLEPDTWYEIVGVAGDVHSFGLRDELRPLVHVPITSMPGDYVVHTAYILARSDAPPLTLVPPLHARIREIDPNAPVLAARTLQSVLAESIADVTFTSTVLAGAALVALLLGAVGLYGVISYAVAERRSEIGVRVVFGASPSAVSDLVLREGAILTVFGLVLGLAGAIVLSRVLESLLFEVSSRDPVTLGAVAALLAAVTLLATWLPARRAALIDPLEAIRSGE